MLLLQTVGDISTELLIQDLGLAHIHPITGKGTWYLLVTVVSFAFRVFARSARPRRFLPFLGIHLRVFVAFACTL